MSIYYFGGKVESFCKMCVHKETGLFWTALTSNPLTSTKEILFHDKTWEGEGPAVTRLAFC